MVDFADLADVRLAVQQHFARFDEMVVAPRQADGPAAVHVQQRHDFFVHMAAQHHFHHVHGFAVGNAHALHEFAFFADFFQHSVNLRAAAVDDDGVDAHQFEQHDVFGKAFFQLRLGHGVAAVFHHQRAACKAADIGQGFR